MFAIREKKFHSEGWNINIFYNMYLFYALCLFFSHETLISKYDKVLVHCPQLRYQGSSEDLSEALEGFVKIQITNSKPPNSDSVSLGWSLRTSKMILICWLVSIFSLIIVFVAVQGDRTYNLCYILGGHNIISIWSLCHC